MLWEIFTFELKFRFKSISLYVYFFLWFTFAFLNIAAENFGPIANSNGKVFLNGPYANTYNDMGAAFFGTIVIAAIFGTSILRDFQRDTVQIMFTKPLSKLSYLGGRWAGSFVACVFAFSGGLLGTFLGTLAPWADATRIAPNHLSWYLQPFFSVVVVQVFFMGSLFFMIAALSRRIFVVYLQGAVFFMAYLIGITVFTSTRSLEHFWSGVFDPIGFLYSDSIARYWTVVEKNSQLFSWSPEAASGVFLYNRLFWMFIGVVSLVILWAFFPVSVEALTARFSGKRAAAAREREDDVQRPRSRSFSTTDLPIVHPAFGWQSSLAQLRSLIGLRMSNILRDFPFWSILALMVANACTNGHFAGRVGGTNVWPVTYLMLQSVEGGSILFLYIVATLYAGELIWRERDTNFHGIHDALPMRESVDWLSKFLALAVIELILLLVAGLCGIVMQTVAGYYHYELLQYGKELFVITFPQVMTFALIAMFVQTVVGNKFIGHAIVIGIAVITPILFNFGFENTLYLIGNTPPYTYSDMNGYGHFVPGLFWSITYWFAVAGLLGTLSVGLARRGAETNLRARASVLRDELPRLAPVALAFLAIAVGSGSWFYYNAHVRNEFLTGKNRRHLQAEYEKQFKKYERTPQPKVIAVDAAIDLYPERRAVLGAGSFLLQN